MHFLDTRESACGVVRHANAARTQAVPHPQTWVSTPFFRPSPRLSLSLSLSLSLFLSCFLSRLKAPKLERKSARAAKGMEGAKPKGVCAEKERTRGGGPHEEN